MVCWPDVPRLGLALLACGVVSATQGGDSSTRTPVTREYPPEVISLLTKAEGGEIKAQLKLADYYYTNNDQTNGAYWFERAAEKGNVEAQLAVASCYLAGRGVSRNPEEAAKWLRRAADKISRTNAPPAQPNPIVQAAQSALPAPQPLEASSNIPKEKPIQRVERLTRLQSVPPEFQEVRAIIRE